MDNKFGFDTTRQDQPATGPLQHRLTSRQLDVLALMCQGMPNKIIGRKLNIANGTVKIHVANILRALNVSSRLQAVIVAKGLAAEPAFERRDGESAQAANPPRPAALRLVKSDDAAAHSCVLDSMLLAAAR